MASNQDTKMDANGGVIPGVGDLPWRTIGPFRGGRVTTVAGCPRDRQTFYMGATGGGVWKTTDGGVTWNNVSDGFFGAGSIGALAVDPSDPDTLYAGTGECSLRGDVSHGDGMYKSTDAGKTWRRIGLEETRHIARVVVDPNDSQCVYAAVLGPLAHSSADRGVFSSRDGGDTWQRVLGPSDDAGAIELRMDPHDSSTLYAALWEVRRRPWGIAHGGPESAVYKSTDRGETWQKLSGAGGLPGGVTERIALACSPARPGRIWALVSSEQQKGLFLSDDHGANWRSVSADPKLFVRPFYFNHMQADSQEPDTVFVLNYRLWKSDDLGESFAKLEDFHADHHDLWIDPTDNQRMIDANDGGACVSFNGGVTWTDAYNQPTGQFYSCTLDDQFPYNVYGPQQDWSTVRIPSQGWLGKRDLPLMLDTGQSEAGVTQVDPRDPDRLIIGDHHWLVEFRPSTGATRFISPSEELNYGWGLRDVDYRFAWSFPVVLSQHDPDVLYVGSQYVHRSLDGGHTWKVLSKDLTLADPTTIESTPNVDGEYDDDTPSHWGPLTRDSNGDQWYASLTTIAESPRTQSVIWTGSDDGLVHLSRDGGATWEPVTPSDLPKHSLIGRIDASPHHDGAACLAANRYRGGDYAPYLFVTTDFGRTWERIDADLPPHDFTRVVRWDPVDKGLLFCGTETGLYVSLNRGQNWTRMSGGLPTVPVHDLKIKGNELVVATHGRGFWIFDHLYVLRQYGNMPSTDAPALFSPQQTVLPLGGGKTPGRLTGLVVGYRLSESPRERFHLALHDAAGRLVSERHWLTPEQAEESGGKSKPGESPTLPEAALPGLRLATLPLNYPHEEQVPHAILKGSSRIGPLAPPGRYRITLTVDSQQFRADIDLVSDPRSLASQADLLARFRFGMRARDELTRINQAILRLREAREKLTDTATPATQAMAASLTAVEDKLIQHRVTHSKQLHAKPIKINDKLYVLANRVAASDGAPTVAQESLLDRLVAEASAAINELDTLLSPDDDSLTD